MPRRIIYIKNPTSGSHFRVLGGDGGPIIDYARDVFGNIMNGLNDIGDELGYRIRTTPSAPNTDHRNSPGTDQVYLTIPTPWGMGTTSGGPDHITLPNYAFRPVDQIGIASLEDWKQMLGELTLPEWETPTLFLWFDDIGQAWQQQQEDPGGPFPNNPHSGQGQPAINWNNDPSQNNSPWTNYTGMEPFW